MMKLQIANEQDRKEEKNRERRRQCEIVRRERIFNARQRKIGVDLPFLEQQVKEKRVEREEQRQKDLALAKQMIKDSELAALLAAREEEEHRRMGADINTYRQLYQRPEDRREYDLNDPDVLKKQLPPRADDTNPVGMASCQRFEGEDVNHEERRVIMAAQMNAWLEQQVQERKAAEEDRKRAEQAYIMAVQARDARSLELDKLESECRRRFDLATQRYNEALAAEKAQRERESKERDDADKLAEMYNLVTSDMLTENPDVAKSALGKNRAIGFMYKGMNKEEQQKFYAAQKEQQEASKAKRLAEEKMDAEWQALAKAIAREACRRDIEEQRASKEKAKMILEENQLLALQQKEQAKYAKEVLGGGAPTEEFYAQFNTTTR